jgi:hypothetical protein
LAYVWAKYASPPHMPSARPSQSDSTVRNARVLCKCAYVTHARHGCVRECACGGTSISASAQRSASAVISAAEGMIDVLALRLLDSTSREVHLPPQPPRCSTAHTSRVVQRARRGVHATVIRPPWSQCGALTLFSIEQRAYSVCACARAHVYACGNSVRACM